MNKYTSHETPRKSQKHGSSGASARGVRSSGRQRWRWCPHSVNRCIAQFRKAPGGPTQPAATVHRVSSARPQNQDFVKLLLWLTWSELRQIRRVCHHLSEYIHLWYLSLASRQRGVWQDPAPGSKNRMLMLQEDPSWYSPRCGQSGDTQKVGKCSSQLRRAIKPQPWDFAVDYHEVLVSFESGRHLQNSSVIRTRSEQQLSRTRCPGWMTNNSTT